MKNWDRCISTGNHCGHHEKFQINHGCDILEDLWYFVVEFLDWTTTFNLFVCVAWNIIVFLELHRMSLFFCQI